MERVSRVGAAGELGGEPRVVVSWKRLEQVTSCCCCVRTDPEKQPPGLVGSLEIFPGAASLESCGLRKGT